MSSFSAAFFPLDVLDKIWPLLASESESFPSYFTGPFIGFFTIFNNMFFDSSKTSG